jgi:hypothetical protein
MRRAKFVPDVVLIRKSGAVDADPPARLTTVMVIGHAEMKGYNGDPAARRRFHIRNEG